MNQRMKRAYTGLCMAIIGCVCVSAQQVPVEDYLKQAGYHAEIYNGKVEKIYNTGIYKNLPYYRSADFTEAAVTYRGNYFPNQKARIDLYREQLIIVPPGKQYPIAVGFANTEKIEIYGKTFIGLTPPKESKLVSGYYIRLLKGREMQLLCKERYTPQKSLQQDRVVYYFDHEKRYYLKYNNRYHPVKNKGSFSKIFPQYKKQINKFLKEHKLDFKQNPDESLTALTGYCEELINSTNTP